MKKKFSVELFYEVEYEIEAENEEEAVEQAVEQWKNTFPNVVVRPAVKEEDRKDIACDICPYYYKDEDEDSPRCHYEWDDRCAPCEIDDFEEEEEDD